MAFNAQKKETGFEHAKLQTMTEPLSVRVDRLNGITRSPIDLPLKEGFAPGTGWTREDVLGLETGVVQWVGGGSFEAKVTDAQGAAMNWRFAYDPAVFLPKVSPTLADAVTGQPQQAQTVAPASGFGAAQNWNQGTPVMRQTLQPPQQQTPFGYSGGGFGPQSFGPWSFLQAPQTAPVVSEVAQMQKELQEERRLRQEERHRADLERANEAHAREMRSLQEQVAKLADNKRPAEDDQIRTLREEIAKEREERRRVEERFERERADERHRAELAAIQQQILTLTQTSQKSDPLLPFMQETVRQQAETAREIARQAEANMSRLTQMQMQPVQLFDLLERKGAGADQLMGNVVNAYNGIFDMYKKATEAAAGPGEPPVVGIIRDGITAATDVAKRFASSREKEAIAQQQVEAMKVQASAQMQMAQMQMAQPPPAPVTNGALNGVASASPAPAPASTPAPSMAQSNGSGKPSDADMFGLALEQVERLRLAVRNGANPEEVFDMIATGVNVITSRKLVVPAFKLIEMGKFVDFIECLIPDAPTALKEAVLARVVEEFSSDEEESGGVEGGDDDE
jgi:hypothetical protein